MATTTEPKTRPILFPGPMVRAILDGMKTQTRRVVFKDDPDCHMPWRCRDHWQDGDELLRCPYQVGMTLWVRESFAARLDSEGKPDPNPHYVKYRADDDAESPSAPDDRHRRPDRWGSPRSMPRWASRITLKVADVRVERLQEIGVDDVLAEGVPAVTDGPHANQYWREEAVANFIGLWDKVNGKTFPWTANPLVWVVSFERTA